MPRIPKNQPTYLNQYFNFLQSKSRSRQISWEALPKLSEAQWAEFYRENYTEPKPRKEKGDGSGKKKKDGAADEKQQNEQSIDNSGANQQLLATLAGMVQKKPTNARKVAEIRRRARRLAERHYEPVRNAVRSDPQLVSHVEKWMGLTRTLSDTVESEEQANVIENKLMEEEYKTSPSAHQIDNLQSHRLPSRRQTTPHNAAETVLPDEEDDVEQNSCPDESNDSFAEHP